MAADPVLWDRFRRPQGLICLTGLADFGGHRFEFEPGDASPTMQQGALDVGPDPPTGPGFSIRGAPPPPMLAAVARVHLTSGNRSGLTGYRSNRSGLVPV